MFDIAPLTSSKPNDGGMQNSSDMHACSQVEYIFLQRKTPTTSSSQNINKIYFQCSHCIIYLIIYVEFLIDNYPLADQHQQRQEQRYI
jgi:hypothetical protein